MDLPLAQLFYILKTMERHGFLRRNGDSKKFLLGTKLMNNQENMSQGTGLQVRDLAASFLEQVVNEFNGPYSHSRWR